MNFDIEDINDILKKVKDYGIIIKLNKENLIESNGQSMYDHLNKLLNDYKDSLLTDKEMSLKTQLSIDGLLSYAVKLSQSNNPLERHLECLLKGIKVALEERLRKEDPLLIGSILFQNKNYFKVLFNGELNDLAEEYLDKIDKKVDTLINKYQITKETLTPKTFGKKIEFTQNNITDEEQLILFKALESNRYDSKYAEKIKQIERILLYRCEYNDPSLSKIEKEYMISSVGKEKCKRYNMKNRKIYLASLDKNDELIEEGGNYNDNGVIYVTTIDEPRSLITTTLHEFEHLKQHTKFKNNVLVNASMYRIFFELLAQTSSEQFEEYNINYNGKLSELFANEEAIREYRRLLIKNEISPNPNKKSNQLLCDRKSGKVYEKIMTYELQQDESGYEYGINLYNVMMIEKILSDDSELIEHYPLLEHFYNSKEKRMKNLTELAIDYKEQDSTGRYTFDPFVEYQVINNGLNTIDLPNMKESDKLALFLMITRNITSLLSRVDMIINSSSSYVIEKNYKLIDVLVNELKFLKNNYAQIKILDKEDRGLSQNLNEDENSKFDEIMVKETESAKEVEVLLQGKVRNKLKANSIYTPSNPFYLMKKYANYDIIELLKSLSKLKEDSKAVTYIERLVSSDNENHKRN